MPCFDNVEGNRMFDDREFFIVDPQGFPVNEEGETVAEPGDNDVTMQMLNGQ